MNKKNRTVDAEIRRSNAVILEQLLAERAGQDFKQTAAFFRVADIESIQTRKKVSPDSVKKAFLKHGSDSLQKFREKHREVSDPTS